MSKSKQDPEPQHPLDYWKLFRELPESYLLFEANDPVFTIVELNKAREKLTHVRRKDALGKPLFTIYPDTSNEYKTGISRVHTQLRKVLKTGRTVELGALRYDLPTGGKKPQTFYWQSSYIPIKNDRGTITHILAAIKDVTVEQLAENRMLRAEERLEAALAIGKVGSWVWDLDANLMVADATMAKMFGIKPSDAARGLPQERFTGVVHKDDVDRVYAAIDRAVRHHSLFEEEYRTTDKRGKMHWVIARAKLVEQNGRRTFPGVLVDITERRDLQAQIELARQQDQLNRQAARILQKRNEELEAINRTKDEFVALASHQLRTPATAVKQYLGMVLQGYVGPMTDLQAEMLDKAFESNERQIKIINQILNAARADTGRLMLSPIPFDLRNLVEAIAADMQGLFKQYGHTFIVDLPKESVEVIGDAGYVRMAVENLLHNACMYTPPGGTVTTRLRRNGTQCQLLITDTGVGIKKSDLGRLFVKFSRIHNPLSVQAGGTGIGLYLAAEIIRLHHGSIAVESKLHHGTTFAISLPLMHNKIRTKRRSSRDFNAGTVAT